jgi:hypothetical protein
VAFVNPDWAMYCWILTAAVPRLHALTRSVRDTA